MGLATPQAPSSLVVRMRSHFLPHKIPQVLRLPAVKKHVADQVSHYKQLRDVKIVESIPKSASGKILRRVLAEQDRAG